jgi:hypothetical protein
MNRLPDRQIDVDDPPRLGRIRRSGNGHVETLAAGVCCDKAKLPQEFLQVAHKAWFIDDDVQAAEALRSCRNEVAFSHCRDEAAQVKGQRKAAVQPGAPLDPRKFSYPTVISMDTEQLPFGGIRPSARSTTGELGKLLARADEDEDGQQHDQQNQDQG